ncbi:MAG: hypothetical protein FWH27_09250 [Planctomycetaceae bacterium]|nr:hypothetical protein [Planctomycetaceae bacterium]
MTSTDLISLLALKTLILSTGVLTALLLFRLLPIRSPGLCRLIWGGVLLLGLLGAGFPVSIPVRENIVQVQSSELRAQSIEKTTESYEFRESETLPLIKMPDIPPQLPEVVTVNVVATPIAAETPPTLLEQTQWLIQWLKPFIFPALLLIWLTGIVVLIARRMMCYCMLLRHLKTATPVQGDDAVLWQTLLREYHIFPSKLSLLTTAGLGPALTRTPYSSRERSSQKANGVTGEGDCHPKPVTPFGHFVTSLRSRLLFSRGVAIIVPADLWQDAGDRVKTGILRHELAHYCRHDLTVCSIVRWLTVLHWFNPLAWLAASKFGEATEWACDVAAFGHDPKGEKHFAESILALHDVTPNMTFNHYAFGGGKLTRRAELLKTIITQPKESAMKKFVISLLALILFVAGTLHVRFVVQANDNEVSIAQQDAGSHGVTALPDETPVMTESDTEFAQRIQTKGLNAARKAFENALNEFNGNILNGTYEQQILLVAHACFYAGCLCEAERKDEAREIAMQIKDWNELLNQAAEQMEDNDERENLLHQISNTYSLFALLGMYDDAVRMANVSIMEGQYNAAEYLTNLARTIARKEGFQRAIPILDEAIVATNKLSREFWREGGILDVAEVYAEVGRENTSRDLIATLSDEGQVRGLLRLFEIAKSKECPDNELLTLLKEAEIAAEQADKSFEPNEWNGTGEYRFQVALAMASIGKITEATTLFENTHAAKNTYCQDDFQSRIGTYYWYNQRDFATAEACVDHMNSPTSKANLLMSILREAKQTENHEMLKRLMAKAEPFVEEMTPQAHRLSSLMQLAAYKMMVGEQEEGRQMLDKLIDEEQTEDEPGLTRNWRISRAIDKLAIAAQYGEAENRIAMLSDDPRYGQEIWVSDAYRSINSIHRHEENPEEWKKLLRNQRLSEENDLQE